MFLFLTAVKVTTCRGGFTFCKGQVCELQQHQEMILHSLLQAVAQQGPIIIIYRNHKLPVVLL